MDQLIKLSKNVEIIKVACLAFVDGLEIFTQNIYTAKNKI